MSQDWANKVAEQLSSRGLIQTGTCLILGASDTGKTTLVEALAKHTASSQPVGIVDADIGQSHIGPPTTVGWAVVNNPQSDFSQLATGGISFVGDVTPVGHLLQLTAAILQCTQQASKVAKLIIIDTPGFIYAPAATALWWTVQRTLEPTLILAVQRNNELSDILTGLQFLEPQIELIKSLPQIPTKSPQERRNYRQNQFSKYFRLSRLYNISLSNVSVQMNRNVSNESLPHRLVAMRNKKGIDVAIGIITKWQNDKGIVVVRAPKIDIEQVHCLIIGDIAIDIPNE
ncbi:MAG: Clp1/GlmU family protein [Sedimentisphaerales bacterium]